MPARPSSLAAFLARPTLHPRERAYWGRRLVEIEGGHWLLRPGQAGKLHGALQSKGYASVRKAGGPRGATELAHRALCVLRDRGQLPLPFMQYSHAPTCGRRDCLNILTHGDWDCASGNNKQAAIVRARNRAARQATT